WRHLQSAYRQMNLPPDPRRAGCRLLRRAALVGDLLDARLYGTWDSEESSGLATQLSGGIGHAPCPVEIHPLPDGPADAPSDRLLADLEAILHAPDGPRTWILVSAHPELARVAQAARRQGVRVILWAADGDAGPDLRTSVDQFVPLQAVL